MGELSSLRQAILPIGAAISGMVIPAVIYLIFNAGKPGMSGWGIPMATDIAFALGILSLVGKRVPLSLKVFLTAVAIIDDLGAVLVIALFYTAEIAWFNVAIGAVFLLALIVINRIGVMQPVIYVILGIGLWVAFLKSGVHTTIAGVLLAATIPSRTRINTEEFLNRSRFFLDEFARNSTPESSFTTRKQRASLEALESASRQVESPLQRLEHDLHPWAAYVVLPVFALANAGVPLGSGLLTSLTHPVALGVTFGLVIGKQLGIVLSVWLMVKSNIAQKPTGVTWRQIYGVGWLAGIGFTMSLFIASLAFEDSVLLATAKVGILLASLVSGIVGWLVLSGGKQESTNVV